MIKSKIKNIFAGIKNCFWSANRRHCDSEKDITESLQPRNNRFEKILLEKALESEEFKNSEYKIPIVIGYDEQNNLLIDDLSRTPHILVGGVCGSGKSIFLQNIITCVTSRFTSDEVQLLLFDLKRVEFDYAKELPHLYGNVIRDVDDAVLMLENLVNIMEERLSAMDSAGVLASLSRKGTPGLDKYNEKCGLKLPRIVAIFDEYAVPVTENDKIQDLILKLVAHGHGAGIHLIIASQRTSDEIFTSTMRAIVPTRAVLRVASKEDSFTMLGSLGAEKLPEYFGEMMYSSIWMGGKPIKVKVPYISEKKMLSLVER